MGFTQGWVETDPDGALITVSQLDNFQRATKIALRERLEGDPTSLLTGLVETGTFAGGPIPKLGAARFYFDTLSNLGVATRQNGRGYFTSDASIGGVVHPRVYSVEGAGVREIAYWNLDGSRPASGFMRISSTHFASQGSLALRRAFVVEFIAEDGGYTITDATNIHIAPMVKGVGVTFTNAIGLLIDAIDQGVSNWAIKTGLGDVEFGDCFHKFDNGNVTIGKAIGTTATAGWPWIPKIAGVPTGVPASPPASWVPVVYDTTLNKLYIYNGAWRGVVLA